MRTKFDIYVFTKLVELIQSGITIILLWLILGAKQHSLTHSINKFKTMTLCITVSTGVRCLSCNDVLSPADCKTVTLCSEDSVSFIFGVIRRV